MRILLCNENRAFGGAERYTVQLAGKLQERGHQVWLACRPGSWLAQNSPVPLLFLPYSSEVCPRSIWKLRSFYRRERIQAVHCQASRDLVTAALAGAAPIKSEHSFLDPHRSSLLDWAYRSSRRVLCVSHALARQMSAELSAQTRLDVLPNGIDEPGPLEIPERLRDGGWVGTAASFLPGKGLEDLCEAARDQKLMIVGDGPLRAGLQSERVWMPGSVSDPLPYLAGLDVVAVPSHKETFSLVALEGMVLGKPVVAYRQGGLPEVVLDGHCGTLVEDVQGLRAALLDYLGNPDKARSHGEAGRRRARERFGWPLLLDRLEAIYA